MSELYVCCQVSEKAELEKLHSNLGRKIYRPIRIYSSPASLAWRTGTEISMHWKRPIQLRVWSDLCPRRTDESDTSLVERALKTRELVRKRFDGYRGSIILVADTEVARALFAPFKQQELDKINLEGLEPGCMLHLTDNLTITPPGWKPR